VLQRQQVTATFFVSDQRTRNGGGALGDQWGTWWKAMAGQGHDFVSQTYDHVAWRSDVPGYRPLFRMRPAVGAFAGREFTFDPPKYCEQISHASQRIEYFTGKKALPLFHAPTGRTSPKLLAAASACGFAHVSASGAGYLVQGQPLKSAMGAIRAGDVLMVDLNTPSAGDSWAVTQFEPLIAGLRGRGLCFEPLRMHPRFRDWIATRNG